MDKDIKNSIIIIALNNLIEDCKNSLETNKTSEEIDYLNFLMNSSIIIIQDIGKAQEEDKEHKIERPKWNIK